MVEENTFNTDPDAPADGKSGDYPAPSPLNRIGVKVGLGMGLLLSLFVIATLVSLIQARIVDGKVREITEVAEPTSAAAFEMEIHLIGTGLGVLQYLQTGDPIHRQRAAKDEAGFERFKAQYDLLAETTRAKELGRQVSLLYQEYKALCDTLMDQADRREVLFATIGENFEELDEILDEKIQPGIDIQGPDGAGKLKESLDMEAEIAEVGAWLGSYLRTPRDEYKLRVFDNIQDVRTGIKQFKNLRLTAEEQSWAIELEDLFSRTEVLLTEVIALEDDLKANLAQFVDLRTELDIVLNDEIQVLTHQELAEASQVAHDMEARTTILVISLLLGGLAFGTFVAFAITKGITGPVGKLVAISRAIARGDLSLRANIKSRDEFGLLGQSFNDMAAQRQQAYEELEIRVRERTAELVEVQEMMELTDGVARILTSNLDTEEGYERFAHEVKQLVDYDRMNINLVDSQTGYFTTKYLVGVNLPGPQPGSARPLDGTRTQHVIETGQALLRSDTPTDQQFPGEVEDAKIGFRSSIMVPLLAKGEPFGVLGLSSCRRVAYGSKEQDILERLAGQIAPALENARLYEERTRVDERLSQSLKMESLGRLAGGVAHDFNNLLTAIMGYSQLSLREAPPDSLLSSHLQEVKKAADRAATLTNQLLTFSRHKVVEPKVLDLNNLIIDLGKMLRRIIGEDIELVTLPASGLEPILADPGQMEQVLMNLAVNAREAMPKGGKLTIETANVTLDAEYVRQHGDASPGPHVMFSVTDTGFGISEEVQSQIFEPFFTTKEVGKGTGLGLATCYGIVQQSGGHIEVSSEPGQGACFKVYLPVSEAPYEAQPKTDDVSNLPEGKETVLLAEDEPMVRSMVTTVLREQGYEVLEASNGEEALRMARQHGLEDIELLLTDVVMPQMSGRELVEKLHATHPGIKVLYTSGYIGESVAEFDSLPAGTEFMPKPYLPDALAIKVREMLDQPPPVPAGSGAPAP